MVYGGPKYKSPSQGFSSDKLVFEKALIERDQLIRKQVRDSMRDKIIILDLRIAMCIKKERESR